MIGHVYAVFRKLKDGSVVDREMQYPTFATRGEARTHLAKLADNAEKEDYFVDVIYRGR